MEAVFGCQEGPFLGRSWVWGPFWGFKRALFGRKLGLECVFGVPRGPFLGRSCDVLRPLTVPVVKMMDFGLARTDAGLVVTD